jgi:hypothetical protein
MLAMVTMDPVTTTDRPKILVLVTMLLIGKLPDEETDYMLTHGGA